MKKRFLFLLIAMMTAIATYADTPNPTQAKVGQIWRHETTSGVDELLNPENGVYGLHTFAEDLNSWDSQFLIVIADELIPAGTLVSIYFEYRNGGDGTIIFNANEYSDPNTYVNNNGWGQIEAAGYNWHSFETEFKVGQGDDGSAPAANAAGIRILAVNASIARDNGTLFMRNIVVKVSGEIAVATKETADDYADLETAPEFSGLYYKLLDNNKRYVSVLGKNCSGNLIIPSSVTMDNITYSVTTIENFNGCNGLTSITIPNSVTSIGSHAFSNCTGLTEIIVESDNTNYTSGNGVLFNKDKTTLIYCPKGKTGTYTIPNSVTGISSSAFSSCSGLTSVTIGNSIISIGQSAFNGCTSLASVTIPNSVTSIGNSAFSGCNGLTSVTIGNSVTSIGNSAFSDCNGLTSVTIPNSVTSIGNSAFANCNSLTSVTTDCAIISRANLYITKDNVRYRVLNKNDVEVVSNNNSDSYSGEVIIPSIVVAGNTFSVKSINSNAFNNCKKLISLTIPNSVTSIGNNAFSGCDSIETLICNTNAISWFFSDKKSLKTVILGDSVTSIGYDAFNGCSGLTSVTIPNSVTSIGSTAFYNCSGLTSVTIPNSVTSIGHEAFSGCYGLTSVTIGNSVTSIGNSAFSDCNGLTSVTIPNSVTSIGSAAFYNCSGLKSIIIGNSVNQIGGSAFSGCNNLASVCIPDSVTSIGDRAFSGCSGLTSVTIPNSVTSIGNNAFENCSGLTSIVIPNTITSIGASAFKDCVNLTIYCQAKVKHTGWNDKWNINECPVVWGALLANVNVSANNSAYGQVSGMGAYIDSTQVKILAIPNTGYVFVKWSDGNTDNPRTILASGDLDFTAVFEIDETQNGNENQGGNNEGNENQGGENTNPGTAVAETAANAISVYAHHNTIIVENATDEIRVYNAMGALVGRDVARCVRAEINVNGAGVYIVKVGNVAKRVMIND